MASSPVGGVLNIPNIEVNADVTSMNFTMFIETIERSDGSTYLQLQYYQIVNLKFLGIEWPHISVATLRKK